MTDFEFIFAVIAIAGGIGFTFFIFGNIFKLIRTKINKNNFNEEAFNRLARAFSKYKKDSERRIENLEAIIAGDEPEAQLKSNAQSKIDTARSIEIDAKPKKVDSETDDSNLRNMLRE
ncbi:MAG TPA: hypothetical protein VFG39_06940 [Balneolaceae bacterium]|nr:hypothetical protein [Balneolaceae bacterium]